MTAYGLKPRRVDTSVPGLGHKVCVHALPERARPAPGKARLFQGAQEGAAPGRAVPSVPGCPLGSRRPQTHREAGGPGTGM